MKADDVKQIAVVGAGLMGHGIAQEFALAGYAVHMHARTEASLGTARAHIERNLDYLVDLGRLSRAQADAAPSRLHATTRFEEAVENADVVIESVFEDLDLKRRIFQQLDEVCPRHTLLASNTSGLMPSSFASATRRPDKVLVAHYANPPHLIPLVEVVPSPETSQESLSTLCGVLEMAGKRPIVVRREVPGFVLNRLQCSLLREALWLVENGVASPRDVDYALSNSIGRRWAVAGIFEVFELPGWDLVKAVAENVFPDLTTSAEVSPVLTDKVESGDLGVRTGKGFYEWTPESADALRQRIAHALVEIERWTDERP